MHSAVRFVISPLKKYCWQWRIQDFPEGDANPREVCANKFGNIFAENCMKMKKLTEIGHVPSTPAQIRHSLVCSKED